MHRFIRQISSIKVCLINHDLNYFRCFRSVARRNIGPKYLDAKVKTTTKYDDTEHVESYKDFIKSVEGTALGDEYEIEKEFLKEDYHGDVIERCDKYFDLYERDERSMASIIKKDIVGRKYFKLDRETNLLTHAAKEQIRFLHKSNPLEWNYRALSECFPISEGGVKKLLRCNFKHTCSEKIKEHDEKVAELWKILKSGKPTNLISSLTQKLYKEGKLVDDYFSGNPKLPTAPPSKIVIKVNKKKKIGEFSAIVQTYVEYQNRKSLTDGKENADENQVALRNSNVIEPSKNKAVVDYKKNKYKYVSDDSDDRDPEVYPCRIKRSLDDSEIPFSQFKDILKHETSLKLKSRQKNKYDEFVMQGISQTDEHISTIKPKPLNLQDCFLKISKYDNSNNIDAAYEKSGNASNVYKYDEKLGYQHPLGKNMKSKIKLHPTKCKKGKLYKVGQCVYDDDGEFLFKVPA